MLTQTIATATAFSQHFGRELAYPDPQQFSSMEEFVSACGYPSTFGWNDIVRDLNIPMNPKGGRRSLVAYFKEQTQGKKMDKPTAAIKVPVEPVMSQQPVKAENPVKIDTSAEPKEMTAHFVNTMPTFANSSAVSAVMADNVEQTALLIAQALAGLKTQTQLDVAQIQEMINSAVRAQIAALKDEILTTIPKGAATTIEIKINGKEPSKIEGATHAKFADLLKHVAVRDNVLLVGGAGSGKTTVCEQVAQALELPFYCQSVCSQTSKAELLGYMSATGQYVATEFRKAYENGGVFVLDEIDAGNPNVIAVLNSALANGYCAFADGMVKKHRDFVLIAAANTFGTGANRQYVGRNQLDAATLDRFSIIEFETDEKLETDLSADKTWAAFVQAVRKEFANEREVISPRATLQGCKLLAVGFSPKYVAQVRLVKGMDKAKADRIWKVFRQYYK